MSNFHNPNLISNDFRMLGFGSDNSDLRFLQLELLRCYFVYLIFAYCNFPSEGFSGGSQSSVAVNSQLPFPSASGTHLTSGTEGR